jgi:uncharacterized protein
MNLYPADPNYNNSKGISYFTGFFMLLGLAILGLVLSSVISIGILAGVSGGGLSNIEEAMKNPENAGLIRAIQVISVLLSMFIPTVIVAYILNRKPFQLIGFRKDVGLNQVGFTILIVLVSIIVAASLTTVNKEFADAMGWRSWSESLEKNYNEQVSMMLDMDNTWGYIVSIIVMAFIPALCEEMLFRGGLQNFLTRSINNHWISILVVSILFSLVHFSVYGFLVRLFLGIILGLIYHYTKNLWLSVTAHFFNNALAVTSIYVLMKQGKNMNEAMAADVPAAYWGLLALPLLYLLFRSLKKTVTDHQSAPLNK